MNELPGTPPRWLRYTRSESGRCHMPVLSVTLLFASGSPLRKFIVDTGAAQSVAPRSFAAGFLALDQQREQDSGMKDAHGNPLLGVPVELELKLQLYYPQPAILLRETLWFCQGIRHGLLGQTSFFEKIGAIFLNSPSSSSGRLFRLFALPEFSAGAASER